MADLPLVSLHRELGAVLSGPTAESLGLGGFEVPLHYGAPEREAAALAQGWGVADRSWLSGLEVLGEDRLRFVNGQVTCDLKSLTPGSGVYGFFTTAKGRVQADAVFLAQADRLWLELPPGLAGPLREHLQKYVIVDRVEIRPLEGWLPLALVGGAAAERLRELDPAAELPETLWGNVAVSVGGVEVRVQRHGGLGDGAFSLWVPTAEAAAVFRTLVEAGAEPVGFAALDTRRIEAGIPRFGQDFGPENFPQETGLEDAVNYKKGCYLGQEVVARLHYRGQVSRQLRGLVLEGGEVPALGAEVLFEERPAGVVSSAAFSPTLGQAIALAILQRRAFEPGTAVEIAGSSSARVVALPFV